MIILQDYSIDVFLRQRWRDDRLKFSGNRKKITVTNPEVSKKMIFHVSWVDFEITKVI